MGAGDADDLAQKLAWAGDNPDALAQMGRNARARYEREMTGPANYSRLIEIYNEAIRASEDHTTDTGK